VNRKSPFGSRQLYLLVAAVAGLAPLGAANANDFIQTAQTGYFQDAAKAPRAVVTLPSHAHVMRNSLGWEIVTYDQTYAPGAQGPVRDDEAAAARDAENRFWARMYPIGGQGTP
jgi:hypothetical protein